MVVVVVPPPPPPPLLFEDFFDTSLKILTPALQVVQVTNMRYGFILALSQKLNLENLLFNNIDTNVFV